MTIFNRSTPQQKLEERRKDILSDIRIAQVDFEVMVQRAQRAGETPDDLFLSQVRDRLEEFETQARQATHIDELDALDGDAEKQGQLRAYICPPPEIADEGDLAIDLLEEWNVPKAVIIKLRNSLGSKLKKAETETAAARSALHTVFSECDSWDDYTSQYEDTMRSLTVWLFCSTVALLIASIVLFHFPVTVLGGLLCAGAAGSCVSVMAKMPALDVRLSGELDSYARRILSRISVGVSASIIGCALLGWGVLPISMQNQTFTNLLESCTVFPPTSCTGLQTLILLGVPMIFGFSERAVVSFEQHLFGKAPKRSG